MVNRHYSNKNRIEGGNGHVVMADSYLYEPRLKPIYFVRIRCCMWPKSYCSVRKCVRLLSHPQKTLVTY